MKDYNFERQLSGLTVDFNSAIELVEFVEARLPKGIVVLSNKLNLDKRTHHLALKSQNGYMTLEVGIEANYGILVQKIKNAVDFLKK